MIDLTDEDEDGVPVGAQVNAVIGEALRQSVSWAELSPASERRLTAALDVEERRRAGLAGPLAVQQAVAAPPVADAGEEAVAEGRAVPAAGKTPAAEAAS